MGILTADVLHYIDRSVLCWLATADAENGPNVSPKEMFTHLDEDTLLVAHLASPVTVKNIKANPKACVSFVDVFVQKGYKCKGRARIVAPGDEAFAPYLKRLADLFGDWPVQAIIEIKVASVTRILAPSYLFFPETKEESQVAAAMRAYGVRPPDDSRPPRHAPLPRPREPAS